MEIGVWGDSITYGACDSEALGWVGRLRKSFIKNDDTSVHNFGVCGDTTEGLLKRFQVEADAIKPDSIIFAIGINDSSENGIPLEKYEQNIRALVKLARKYTDKIYIIGSTKVDETIVGGNGWCFVNETIKAYNKFLKEFSESEGLTYVDVFDTLNISADLADGLHPNAQGYEKLFRIIQKFIK